MLLGWAVHAGAGSQRLPSPPSPSLPGAPRGVEFKAVKEVLLSVKGVKGAHNLHLWALTLSHHVLAVHIAIGECMHVPAPLWPFREMPQRHFVSATWVTRKGLGGKRAGPRQT